MRLDVPFVPDEAYIRFLNDRREHIHSLHFSLCAADVPDARHSFRVMDTETLADHLRQVPGPKKYALLNSRFHRPEDYFAPARLRSVTDRLALLLKAGVLDGIVCTDAYFLQALSDADRSVASALEAVPGINCMADTFDKIVAVLDGVAASGFRMPEKFIPDRSLNRKLPELADISARCGAAYPGMRLGLLANEGCIWQCPFKPAHDAHIALSHTGVAVDTFEMNRTWGCMRYFRDNPHMLLRSPFIRPEDAARYADHAELIKICGRTLGPAFLMKVITAYTEHTFTGNLSALLDTTTWMADEYDLPNHALPADFFDRVTSCDQLCRSCGYCQRLFDAHARKRPFRLRDLRGE
ncbi:hypothetical protein DENIS_2158 [Desulfonema ishimotonii]|uniref:Peptidase U32 n=2 Tax=Desulfonema ishimotonii TaxID=45657 RepID=A0A401FW54_9BACT|nr:hypothetical protein DENIS_2158 [Desulfonema ishimotonii]